MKKLLFVLMLLVVLLAACGPSDVDCALAWEQLDVDSGDEGFMMNIALNSNWPPDSIGYTVKECIEGGWDGWR